MEARLERHKRYFPRPWHDRNREVGNVVFFQSGQVEQRLRRVDAGRDSADKIKESNAGSDERERGRVDRCAEKAITLLKNLNKIVDLRPQVKMCLDNGLKRSLDGSRRLHDTPV